MELKALLDFLLTKQVSSNQASQTTFKLIFFSTFCFSLFIVAELNFEQYIKWFTYPISFLPAHRIQAELTLNFFFPIISILTLSTFTAFIFKYKKNNLKLYFATLAVVVLLSHLYIWLIVQPMCVTGCESGSGGNDGNEDVFGVVLLLLPFLHFIVYLISRLTEENKKITFFRSYIIEWSFSYIFIHFFLFIALILGQIIKF